MIYRRHFSSVLGSLLIEKRLVSARKNEAFETPREAHWRRSFKVSHVLRRNRKRFAWTVEIGGISIYMHFVKSFAQFVQKDPLSSVHHR
jgi:hypothetical protein